MREQVNQKIRIVIAGNRKLFRELFCLALKDEECIDIVAEVENLCDVIDVAFELKSDIILLDIAQTEFNVEEILAEVAKNSPDVKILPVALDLKDEEIQLLIKAGARGYISTKNASKADLISAIKSVQRGEFWIERKIIAKLLIKEFHNDFKTDKFAQNPKELLTEREKEVLRYLCKGFSNKEIASSLFISDKTVKCHLNSIFKKLNISSRIEAILYAIQHGLSLQMKSRRQIVGCRS